MTTTVLPPEVRVVRGLDVNRIAYTAHMVVNVPGGPPGEEGITIMRPLPGVSQDEMFTETVRTATGSFEYYRSWSSEKHFVGSPVFPEGLEIGVIKHFTDYGVGQPGVEKTEMQVSPDQYERLRACANGEPYLSMSERRGIAKRSEKWVSEQRAAGKARPETPSPLDAIQDLAGDRLMRQIDAKIDAAVETRVAARLRELEAQAAEVVPVVELTAKKGTKAA